ncbi:hypothetical protein [Acinetobacter baumannii]|uniref:hypothetical protein n=1 Tax=Acinetobacter baumannii TaxID=470 RepID=UPI00021B7B60|nr:hypothetical protein [Acinetobacter baumannii]KCY93843.1 hypothetical protein J729_0828 [Acinetobacter baumannii 929679-598]EGT97414.1 hypothetical protein ABNIH3_10743 [Acinetobacter baumannii ABNIH3]EHU1215831.1 hypothetical protein [Acinetobacter baumannii]EHU2778257.1 hypothetical protein [Acinetobacter baumannii]EYS55561.1 hypothetical protein K006_0903 [Acinetobacter baumannii 16553_10]
MTIFIDTNGEMDFADNERLRFVMHFLKLGSHPDVLEIKNNRFVREDAETSFQEIWLPCATAKQKEIDDLKAELEKANAQAVQQSFDIGRLQDRITELLDERQDLYAQINNDQAVPDTQQKLTDTYYLEGSDYVVDCPFEYDIEIDKGKVLELQKWQRTDSTKVYFANIYKDEDNFEILQFASKAEAENAVAENLKFLEASESGAEE